MMQNIPLIVQLAGFKENKLQEVFQNYQLQFSRSYVENVQCVGYSACFFKMRCSNPEIRVNWL